MEQGLDAYERPYDARFPVVCMDESPKQVVAYKLLVGRDGKHYADSEYVRKGGVELFVASEPLAGRRTLTAEADHTATTWVKFVAQLMDTVYAEATKVTWVLDNFSTHKLSFFYAVFPPAQAKAYVDRMEIVHPPAHGSWLNLAEIEFSVFTRQHLNRPFASADQVAEVARCWVKTQNEKKKTINWPFKTADARVKRSKLYPTI